MAKLFRFEDLDIWKKGALLSKDLFILADKLEDAHKYRFAEQLRAATLSITNNIAEGSGSSSDVDFKNFLNMSRRSVSEVANILILMKANSYVSEKEVDPALVLLQEESKMITGFMKSLDKSFRD